uniref:Expressed protein n=1 Tax=Schizophyllum commune (strain H4-8 / FGSC 9210) TaxID=578458 RepID=D8PK40_SCHCM
MRVRGKEHSASGSPRHGKSISWPKHKCTRQHAMRTAARKRKRKQATGQPESMRGSTTRSTATTPAVNQSRAAAWTQRARAGTASWG